MKVTVALFSLVSLSNVTRLGLMPICVVLYMFTIQVQLVEGIAVKIFAIVNAT